MRPARRPRAAAVRAGGGLLAGRGREPGEDGTLRRRGGGRPARAAGREDDYALLVEAILEGYLQHYGDGRVRAPDDPDLALLAGDRLYAMGLARLAELGDLDAVAELADVISLGRPGAGRGRRRARRRRVGRGRRRGRPRRCAGSSAKAGARRRAGAAAALRAAAPG